MAALCQASVAKADNEHKKARSRMQNRRRKQAALATKQEPALTNGENSILKPQSPQEMDETTVTGFAQLPLVKGVSLNTPSLTTKSEVTKNPRKCSTSHRTIAEANRAKFRKVAVEGPSCVCSLCNKLCYQIHGTFAKQGMELPDFMQFNASEEDEIWLFTRCQSPLNRKKIPSCALVNNMHISEVPKELQGLNSLKERLISRITPFMKLVVLPRGHQREIRGQVINFPTPISNTIDQLPRPVEDTDIIYVQANQKVSKTREPHLQGRTTVVAMERSCWH